MASGESGRDQFGVPQDRLSAVVNRIARPVSWIFVLVVLFTFYEVAMRYVFNAPTSWVHETTTAMTAACFAIGGAYCVAIDKHIRVVLIYDAVSPPVRRWMDVGISIIGFLACALMTWAAWSLVDEGFWRASGEFRLQRTGSALNPPTPAIIKLILFLTLCAMTVQFALQTVRHARRDPHADTRSPAEEPAPDA